MNEHFLNGFIKAAQEAGVPDEQIASMLEQQGGANPEEAPAPAEHGAPEHGGGHEEEIEHLLSQLSPEELEQLVQEISQMQEGGAEGAGAPPEGADQIPAAAAGIEQQLSNHPAVAEETAPQPNPDEATLAKQSAINFIKSANYIEGFLEQAMGRGMGLKQAVELYDSAFTTTFNQLKQSELIGGQKKLDVNHNGKIDGDDLKKLRAGKETAEVDEKTAAYYEGVLERAREYGMSDAEAIQVVKEAMEKSAGKESLLTRGATALGTAVGTGIRKTKEIGKSVKGTADRAGKAVYNTVSEHPIVTSGIAAGGVAAGYSEGRHSAQDKDKD
jgi:DNA-binding transcriptional MerR regulator